MFDIGFPELMLISVVALLVIGPERLPETVRSIALWIGRFRRSFGNLRAEIEREIGADEIRAQLRNEAIMADYEKTRSELASLKSEVEDTVNAASRDLKVTREALEATPTEPPPPEPEPEPATTTTASEPAADSDEPRQSNA